MSISIFDKSTAEPASRVVSTTVSDYFKDNVFTITYNDIANIIINKPIEPFKTTPIKDGQIVKIQFTLYAIAADKVKNPQPTKQSFNFNFTRSGNSVATAKPKFAEKPLSITLIGESDVIQGNGTEYFNIKKPGGGYICYKFNAPQFDDSKCGNKTIIDLNGYPVSASYIQGINYNYTYVYTVNEKGTFKLSIEYYPYGFTSPVGGEVLMQTVLSLPFTL